jgi:hypothetical protein
MIFPEEKNNHRAHRDHSRKRKLKVLLSIFAQFVYSEVRVEILLLE